MTIRWTVLLMFVSLAWGLSAARGAEAPSGPLVSENLIFEEVEGSVAVEAEHFFKQTHTDVRRWYITTPQTAPNVPPDGDPPHASSASGGACVEVLPDTRRTHDDKLITGENFTNRPGKIAILYYKVHFNTAGRYYVWGRLYSTNTEDNGMHVGIDGEWPDSGKRMQWTGRDRWVWKSKQRTKEKHIGEPHKLYLDVAEPGEHVIMFSMREDGTEFDKWLMTLEPKQWIDGPGPDPRVKKGELPAPFAIPECASAQPASAPATRPAATTATAPASQPLAPQRAPCTRPAGR